MPQRLKYGIFQDDGVLSSAADVTVPENNFSLVLWDTLTSASGEKLLIDAQTGDEYSGHHVRTAAATIASMLQKLGMRDGQVVSCCCDTSVLNVCAIIGINFAAGAYAGSYFNHLKQEWQQEVSDTNAAILICSPGNVQDAQSIADSVENVHGIIVLMDSGDKEPAVRQTSSGKAVLSISMEAAMNSTESLSRPVIPKVDAKNAVCYIPFSSGSTGLQKAVSWSSRSLLTNIMAIAKHNEDGGALTRGSVVQLCSLGLSCMPGLYQLLVGILSHHLLVIANSSFIDNYWDIVTKYNCTHSIIVTAELIHVTGTAAGNLDTDTLSLRQVETLGSPLPEPVAEAFSRVTGHKVRVTSIYGSVEGGFTTRFPDGVNDLTTVGSLLSHVKMRVRDNKKDENLPLGQMGELQVGGDQVCSGYLNNEEATKENFVQENAETWFKTGDVGFIDSDGLIHVVARVKHIIKFEGYQVAPAELESILLTHELVSQAVVIGIPDPVHDEVPKAFVVLKDESATEQIKMKLALEIRSFVDGQVADIKQLRGGIEFLEKMPFISFGKVDRNALKNLHHT